MEWREGGGERGEKGGRGSLGFREAAERSRIPGEACGSELPAVGVLATSWACSDPEKSQICGPRLCEAADATQTRVAGPWVSPVCSRSQGDTPQGRAVLNWGHLVSVAGDTWAQKRNDNPITEK